MRTLKPEFVMLPYDLNYCGALQIQVLVCASQTLQYLQINVCFETKYFIFLGTVYRRSINASTAQNQAQKLSWKEGARQPYVDH